MEIRKSEVEYTMKSMRFLLLIITTMFIFIAALMIVLGISVYSRYHDFSFIYESARSGRFVTPSVIIVLLGMILMVITCFGFFGALKKSTCLVNMYALILTMVLIAKIVLVIILFSMDPETIASYIEIPTHRYATDVEIEKELDFLQSSLGCCGSESYMEYMDQPFNQNHSTVIFEINEHGYSIMELPKSCCREQTPTLCTRIWSNGCKNTIGVYIVQNASVLGVLGVSVMFIKILGIIFAILLGKCIRKYKSEKAYLRWKACEQRIMTARKVQEAAKAEQDGVFIETPKSSNA
ncbi:Tetraspanin-15 [Eumeta japonica]|uniref:Tetraspanin n=1 Tax=Eumeta variegata TaxID=151549 RepID=A0A4C1UIK3_EUMVA|nr:Tetraspanin-15 [Eumeta japonica]